MRPATITSIRMVLIVPITASALLGLTGRAWGGAWTQADRGYYIKLSTGYFRATEDIDASGERISKPGEGVFKDFSSSVYVEFGLTESLTLVTTAPYKRLHDRKTFIKGITKERRTGFGDLELRVRRALITGRTVVSLAVGGKVPLWKEDDPGTRVPLSSRHTDGEARLQVGRSISVLPGYVTGEFGYRMRGGNLGDEVLYSLEGGVSLRRFLIKGFISGVRSTGDCQSTAEVGLIGDQNVTKVSPGIIFNATSHIELSLELISIVSGCNTTAGSTWLIGLAVKR